jgi:hypothetical protein
MEPLSQSHRVALFGNQTVTDDEAHGKPAGNQPRQLARPSTLMSLLMNCRKNMVSLPGKFQAGILEHIEMIE